MTASEPLRAPDSPLTEARLQIQIIGIRWALTILYPALTFAGVIDVSGPWFAMSAGFLTLYHAVYTWYTWHELTRPSFPENTVLFVPFLDTAAVSLALIAIGDPLHPIWGVYFFVIAGVAFFYHRVVWPYSFWLMANYAALGLAIHLRGLDVPAAYMAVAAIVLLAGIADLATFTSGERRLRGRLSVAARTDPLTGISNRRALEETLDDRLRSAHAHGHALALLMVDIDGFKRYNTHFGHLAADGVLEQMAESLLSSVRDEDFVARFGGDEFVVILPDVDLEEASSLAERLRQRIENGGLCTISIGVSGCRGGVLAGSELLDEADGALLRAKEAGRNRVKTAGSEVARAA